MRKERAKGGRCARMYVGGGVGIRRKETRRGLECDRKEGFFPLRFLAATY